MKKSSYGILLCGILAATCAGGCARGSRIVINKPYGDTVAALHRYSAEINAHTKTTRQASSMETDRAGKSHTLQVHNVMNSFGGAVASINVKPGRQHTTNVRVLCDPLGAQGSSLGTRSRELEQARLKEFTDFLDGRISPTNYQPVLRLAPTN